MERWYWMYESNSECRCPGNKEKAMSQQQLAQELVRALCKCRAPCSQSNAIASDVEIENELSPELKKEAWREMLAFMCLHSVRTGALHPDFLDVKLSVHTCPGQVGQEIQTQIMVSHPAASPFAVFCTANRNAAPRVQLMERWLMMHPIERRPFEEEAAALRGWSLAPLPMVLQQMQMQMRVQMQMQMQQRQMQGQQQMNQPRHPANMQRPGQVPVMVESNGIEHAMQRMDLSDQGRAPRAMANPGGFAQGHPTPQQLGGRVMPPWDEAAGAGATRQIQLAPHQPPANPAYPNADPNFQHAPQLQPPRNIHPATAVGTAQAHQNMAHRQPPHPQGPSLISNVELEKVYFSGPAEDSDLYLRTSLDTKPPTFCTRVMFQKVKAEDTENLSHDCIRFVAETSPPREEMVRKVSVCTSVSKIIAGSYQRSSVQMFGSSGSNLCSKGSDVDICLLIPEEEIQRNAKGQRKTARFRYFLIGLAKLLTRQGMMNVEPLPNARVPIIKFQARDGLDFSFDCDLCVNNVLACINTNLLFTYTMLDARVRPLIMCIKHWVKQRQIHNAFRGYLSSYTYSLMVIQYLQYERILPCLQNLKREEARQKNDSSFAVQCEGKEYDCYFYRNVESLAGERNNPCSLGLLLVGFFHFYSNVFSIGEGVVSIRSGRLLKKTAKGWDVPGNNKNRHVICIEDPFDVNLDLGRYVDENTVKDIEMEFARALKILQSSGRFSELCAPWTESESITERGINIQDHVDDRGSKDDAEDEADG
ncbi:hypothetical protein GUITHDRAFT_103980 [Guillardia theta CCMP2712]|uniref:Uncharacterized protein n=1 Tax=Guillardia theta (strain CCMP2712) TaxID=905079 RepID=L1JNX6_GUITC|nr:hypothetical protein GUITHDRAFT_103980 [Guillardia theta CCMP2712]EKX50167.1 hypothetical protein GUITHDRAFT_103980 [Guillardia theta CCMP2712]|eukprot:XP_005837147.1 hypothetical protein GUITHDRAFT_103980 [Guillardia theta CCMP2712]